MIWEQITEDFSPLLQYDLVYLATPYTKYPWGIYEAAHDAAVVAGRLLLKGVNIFSPIVHSHQLSMVTRIDPVDHDFWIHVDEAFMRKADALLICQMSSWEDSRGMSEEIMFFEKHDKPVYAFRPLNLR